MQRLRHRPFLMGTPQPTAQASASAFILEQLHDCLTVGEASVTAITAAEDIIKLTTIPSVLTIPDIEVDNEELDVTWRNNGKLLRLMTYATKAPKVYSHVDSDNPFTRGNLTERVDASVLSEKLDWLLS